MVKKKKIYLSSELLVLHKFCKESIGVITGTMSGHRNGNVYKCP